MGLLTERSVKTLLCYLTETNLHLYHWMLQFLKQNPFPKDGSWDDVSGETFLRKLLAMPIMEAKYDVGRDPVFDCTTSCGVDPRNIAQRIMEIRTQLAKEFSQDLSGIAEENSLLLRETLTASLSNLFVTADAPAPSPGDQASGSAHPEMLEHWAEQEKLQQKGPSPDLDLDLP